MFCFKGISFIIKTLQFLKISSTMYFSEILTYPCFLCCLRDGLIKILPSWACIDLILGCKQIGPRDAKPFGLFVYFLEGCFFFFFLLNYP